MKIIARVHNDFKEKFGIPRQSGIANEFLSVIIFEPEYRVKEALRGIEGYSHLWLIWNFSLAEREDWSPTVRPPRLGGNKRLHWESVKLFMLIYHESAREHQLRCSRKSESPLPWGC